ncbi:conserved hypothetical protein [Cenarchaeum symbiosum A]|uniref:2-phospho-L-lactate guanylyltransferase n=1 Tax=Cenarchaeum symbiosum (strain A) TaxID=414004 RepID=A0RWX3_CENSY|nr:conserved hypothetical protein [Cenarchaeum symbiosum A]
MRVSAIIPVKSFAIAKSRLGLPPDKTAALCKMMLDELLDTVCASPAIDDTVVVTRDAQAAGAARKRGAYVVEDQGEGVNRAVAIADAHLASDPPDSSVIFPQDIPFMKTQDVDFMMRHAGPPPCAIVVPSRRFDGTNALYRSPSCLMETHYDEDSYKIHLTRPERRGAPRWSLCGGS